MRPIYLAFIPLIMFASCDTTGQRGEGQDTPTATATASETMAATSSPTPSQTQDATQSDPPTATTTESVAQLPPGRYVEEHMCEEIGGPFSFDYVWDPVEAPSVRIWCQYRADIPENTWEGSVGHTGSLSTEFNVDEDGRIVWACPTWAAATFEEDGTVTETKGNVCTSIRLIVDEYR